MNATVFCIECQEMTHMECGLLCGHEKHVTVYDSGEVAGVDVDFCDYPAGFAFCPPPELPVDWDAELVEPGVEVVELQSFELVSA